MTRTVMPTVKPPTLRSEIKNRSQPRPTRHTIARPRCSSVRQIEIEGNVVVTAPKSPKAVINFLGGAFAGASPTIFYERYIQRLAQHFTVVCTPYPITFQHDVSARNCHASFLTSLQTLRSDRATAALVSDRLPIYGVGHSNGALLHMMMGSICPPLLSGNVIISFNNREVGEAVPVPIEPLQATIKTVRTDRSLEDLATTAAQAAIGSLLQGVQAASALLPQGGMATQAEASLRQLVPFGAQIGSVLDEVGDGGALEFTPPPAVTRQIIQQGYKVPSTLLIKFSDDSIDETDEMVGLLRTNANLDVNELVLPGNHLTPVGPQIRWPVSSSFSPADALLQAVVQTTQKDLDVLADKTIEYLLKSSSSV